MLTTQIVSDTAQVPHTAFSYVIYRQKCLVIEVRLATTNPSGSENGLNFPTKYQHDGLDRGDIILKAKRGKSEPQPTGYTVKDLRKRVWE